MSVMPAHLENRAPSRRAATAVWITGGLLLFVSACCAATFVVAGSIPLDQLREQTSTQQIPAETWEQIEVLQPMFALIAVGIVTGGVLPAAALLVLGFYVRRHRRGAIITSLILTLLLLACTGFIALSNILSIATGAGGGVLGLLPILGLIALIVWTASCLRHALAAPHRFRATPPRHQSHPRHRPVGTHALTRTHTPL